MSSEGVLAGVGVRLRLLRHEQDLTLALLSETTGISVSTLSRLESGHRKPTLELLLPLARAHGVALAELVDAPETGEPRVRLKAGRTERDDHAAAATADAASRRSPGLQAGYPA